jgi:hypothetical protein
VDKFSAADRRALYNFEQIRLKLVEKGEIREAEQMRVEGVGALRACEGKG